MWVRESTFIYTQRWVSFFFHSVFIHICMVTRTSLFILLHKVIANERKNSLGKFWCNFFRSNNCFLRSVLRYRVDKKKQLLNKGHIWNWSLWEVITSFFWRKLSFYDNIIDDILLRKASDVPYEKHDVSSPDCFALFISKLTESIIFA